MFTTGDKDGVPKELQPSGIEDGSDKARAPVLTRDYYDNAYKAWDDRASVRGRAEPPAGYSRDGLFFSPGYSALFLHDKVLAAPQNVQYELLVAQLYVYLRFTVYLEMGPVNEVANLLRQPSFLPWLPRSMKGYAHHVYTDEAWHADFSATLISEAINATGVPDVTTYPAFMETLSQLELAEEPEFRSLVKLFFVIISETLITGTLAGVPKDPRVQERIRFFVDIHREDEGRHHRYFKDIFCAVWPRLPQQLQRKMGLLLPDMVLAFLRPDARAMQAILSRYPSEFPTAQRTVDEILKLPAVMKGIEDAARHTTTMLRQGNVFDDPFVTEAFEARGFNVPGTSQRIKDEPSK